VRTGESLKLELLNSEDMLEVVESGTLLELLSTEDTLEVIESDILLELLSTENEDGSDQDDEVKTGESLGETEDVMLLLISEDEDSVDEDEDENEDSREEDGEEQLWT
jgi:hypothetical protein